VADEPYYERISFRVSAIGARAELRFRELLAPLGLIPHSYAVLHRIDAAGGITQQGVADLTGMRRSVMVAVIDDLEQRRLVERRRHPHDRRANALHLTTRGRKALRRAEAAADQLDAEIVGALPPGEHPGFAAALHAIDDGFGSKGGIHPNATLRPERPPPPRTGSRLT